MSIIAGYTRSTDDENVTINTYESVGAAETAIADDTSSNVATYWLASYINPDTNTPDILAYIDP